MIFLAKTCCPLPEQRLRIPARRAMVDGVTSNSKKMSDKALGNFKHQAHQHIDSVPIPELALRPAPGIDEEIPKPFQIL
jgi:hypothetical protein